MSDPVMDLRNEWMARVLGVRIAAPAAAAGPGPDPDLDPNPPWLAEAVDDEPADPLPSPQQMADAVEPELRLRALGDAHALAASNLEASFRAMLRMDAFENDPQAEDERTQAAIDGIGDKVPDLAAVTAAVGTVLAKLADTSVAARPALVKPALAALRSYRAQIDAEPLLREMEQTPAGSYRIHAALTEALDDLVAALGS